MNMNLKILETLELKLAEYSKDNGTIAEHASTNNNYSSSCNGICTGACTGTCKYSCSGACLGPK